MKRLALLLLVSSVACKGSDKKAGGADEGATAATVVEPEGAPGRGGIGGMAGEMAPTAAPRAYIYSEEAGKEALEAMTQCANPYTCDALDTLVGFGKKVSPDLSDLAVNAKNSESVRKVALEALKQIKDPAVGLDLFEAAKAEEEFMVRRELFKVAGESGGDEAFDAMIAYYASEDAKEHRTDMRSGLRAFGAQKIFGWASENYPEEADSQVRFADLIGDASEAASKEAVVALIAKTTDVMAKHRLAKVAVELGDDAQLEILIAGLKSDDQYDRSDAANFLQDVTEKIPEAQRAEVIELVKAAKGKDQGGLTTRGFDSVLKKLSAE